MKFPLVVSFCTADTPYELEIQSLKASCVKFGMETYFEVVPSKGSWVENCANKGPFIANCISKFQQPILWLDADAVIMRHPKLFEKLECDFAAYKPRHLISSTLFFANTDSAIELANNWAEKCLQNPTTWDQKLLDLSLEEMGPRIKFQNLPQGYCKIFDKRWARIADREEYIVQNQASRRFKGIANQRG